MSKEKRNILIYSFSGLVLLTLITFSGVKNNNRKVSTVDVYIEQKDGNFFTDQLEVLSLMTLNESDYVEGVELRELDPKKLEQRIESNPFINDAQVYRDLKGNLRVKVTQSEPIARVFIAGEADRYIDQDGNILPVNAKHTARVPLLETAFEFSWEKNLNETSYGRNLFDLLKFIEEDEFWRAQIAHVMVQKDGAVEMLPQVTKQRIEFGMPEDFESKFKKLMIFYKEILPTKGWNVYNTVNVKFENQIICE